MLAIVVSSEGVSVLLKGSSMTDGDARDLCLLLRSTLMPSEHGKLLATQRSHLDGHIRGVGAHYQISVSSSVDPSLNSLLRRETWASLKRSSCNSGYRCEPRKKTIHMQEIVPQIARLVRID
jgi:hypothetical protein